MCKHWQSSCSTGFQPVPWCVRHAVWHGLKTRLMFPIRCHETQPPSRRDAEEDAESTKQNEFLGAFLCVLGVSAVALCPCCYPLAPDWRHEPKTRATDPSRASACGDTRNLCSSRECAQL